MITAHFVMSDGSTAQYHDQNMSPEQFNILYLLENVLGDPNHPDAWPFNCTKYEITSYSIINGYQVWLKEKEMEPEEETTDAFWQDWNAIMDEEEAEFAEEVDTDDDEQEDMTFDVALTPAQQANTLLAQLNTAVDALLNAETGPALANTIAPANPAIAGVNTNLFTVPTGITTITFPVTNTWAGTTSTFNAQAFTDPAVEVADQDPYACPTLGSIFVEVQGLNWMLNFSAQTVQSYAKNLMDDFIVPKSCDFNTAFVGVPSSIKKASEKIIQQNEFETEDTLVYPGDINDIIAKIPVDQEYWFQQYSSPTIYETKYGSKIAFSLLKMAMEYLFFCGKLIKLCDKDGKVNGFIVIQNAAFCTVASNFICQEKKNIESGIDNTYLEMLLATSFSALDYNRRVQNDNYSKLRRENQVMKAQITELENRPNRVTEFVNHYTWS